MPYIKQIDREAYRPELESIVIPETAGELNYVLTMIFKEYLEVNGESYQRHAEIHGVLIGALLEFYRRKSAPYEDKKIEENGDVY